MIQLKILSGKMAGTETVARRFPFRIGRSQSADLRLEEDGVWDEHLELAFDAATGFVLTAHQDALAAVNGQAFPGYGLSWLAAFGQEHGKQIGLPEWGLVDTGTDAGGGDDAYYMTQMADWIKANASGPVIFWNYGGGTLPLDIPNYTSGGTPAATAAFRAAFMS